MPLSTRPISAEAQAALDLKANDSAVVKITGDQTKVGSLALTATGTANDFVGLGVNSWQFQVKVAGEANPKFGVGVTGTLFWGAGGANAVDTSLYRSAADALTTDDALNVGGALTVAGALNATSIIGTDLSVGAGLIRGRYLTSPLNSGACIRIDEGGGLVALARTTTTAVPLTVLGMTSQTAALQQWMDVSGAIRAKVDINGYFTSGNGVNGGAQYVLNTPTGANDYIIWNVAGVQKWYDQVPGASGTRIMYDVVNTKAHITLTTGAGVGGGVTALNSALTVAGNVGFYGGGAVAKPTGVAVTAAGIHAALVTLGLIAA